MGCLHDPANVQQMRLQYFLIFAKYRASRIIIGSAVDQSPSANESTCRTGRRLEWSILWWVQGGVVGSSSTTHTRATCWN